MVTTNSSLLVDETFRGLIPPLTDEERTEFERGRLGFEGGSKDGTRHVYLIPTPIGHLWWLWAIQDLQLKLEEYSPSATAVSRIPWTRFRGIELRGVRMEPKWKYPPIEESHQRERPRSHLYVIQAVNGGPVKIGMSRNPDNRVEELQPGSPFPLQVIRVYPHQGRYERSVHKALSQWRLHGEWFEEDVVEHIEDIMVRRADNE